MKITGNFKKLAKAKVLSIKLLTRDGEIIGKTKKVKKEYLEKFASTDDEETPLVYLDSKKTTWVEISEGELLFKKNRVKKADCSLTLYLNSFCALAKYIDGIDVLKANWIFTPKTEEIFLDASSGNVLEAKVEEFPENSEIFYFSLR